MTSQVYSSTKNLFTSKTNYYYNTCVGTGWVMGKLVSTIIKTDTLDRFFL